MINMKMAQLLNYYRRMLLGAQGATSMMRFPSSATGALTIEERKSLRKLEENGKWVASAIATQIEAVEEFYFKHGSEKVRADIAKRREIRKKNLWDRTEEENYILYPSLKPKKKHKQLNKAMDAVSRPVKGSTRA